MKPGDDIKPVINADDHVVEFEITPNRPDCLSVIGLAREVAATYDSPWPSTTPVVKGGAEGVLTDLLDVETPAADLVPRYTARMVRNVKIAPSPKWMRERLRSMGVRPINNIVDITNYVMLEYGQPMHAFDYRYVKGGKIIVRRAEEGEELTTLDGNVRKLTANHLVIADETRAVGLAGIMGGENSEIVADTADVVFESACFDGTCIRKGALALGMRTEASAKFEKGLDPLNTLPAVDRACELVELLGAGEVVDGVIDVLNFVPQPHVIRMDPERVNALLGTDIPAVDSTSTWSGWTSAPRDGLPQRPRRRDHPLLAGRRGGHRGPGRGGGPVLRLQQHPHHPHAGPDHPGRLSAPRRCWSGGCGRVPGLRLRRDHHLLLHLPHLVRQDPLARGLPAAEVLQDPQPPGEDTSIMRTTTLPSMLEILTRNYNYRNQDVKLYEVGRIYLPGGADGLAIESKVLTLGAYGGDMDFYAMKGVIEAVLKELRVQDVTFRTGSACRRRPPTTPAGTPRCGAAATAWAVSARSTPWWPGTTAWTPSSTARSCPWTSWRTSRAPTPSMCPCPSSPPSPGTSPWCATRPSPWALWRSASARGPGAC